MTYIVWSGQLEFHQVSLNDPTSHSLLATLSPRQGQSRWPNALKVAGCNKLIGNCNFYISYSYIGDLMSGQCIDLPIRSQWGGGVRWLIFWQILVVIKHYHGWHQQILLCDSREVMWRHQRSPKRFWLIASGRKELQQRTWSHCAQLIKTHRMICILTLRSPGHVTWCQPLTLICWDHHIHISMRIDESMIGPTACRRWSFTTF